MNQYKGTICQKIARAAQNFERLRTRRGRVWTAVFLNEETIVIALQGSLTAAESALARSPAGAAEIRDFQQHLFAAHSADLLSELNRMTGLGVDEVQTQIDPSTGCVTQFLKTDTVGEKFLADCRGPSGGSRTTSATPAAAPGYGSNNGIFEPGTSTQRQ